MRFEKEPTLKQDNSDVEIESGEKEDFEFRKFLKEQVVLPCAEWDEKFKTYVEEKFQEVQPKEEPEPTIEEERERTYLRYLEELSLTEKDIKDKRILDIGCASEGEFVRYCIEKGISKDVYGLDARIEPDKMSKEDGKHFFNGNFQEELPVKNNDYVIAVGAVRTPLDEEEVDILSPKKTILSALEAIKKTGEVRIAPVEVPAPDFELKGLEISNQQWQSILQELEDEEGITWERRPTDIFVSQVRRENGFPDVWLREVLIVHKKDYKELEN
ncbi:MAG: hypothetical protein HQ539_01365 [Parcubacteria group bacterium]|nr:hypothetical protein [Parcubacteria group bacterium]